MLRQGPMETQGDSTFFTSNFLVAPFFLEPEGASAISTSVILGRWKLTC